MRILDRIVNENLINFENSETYIDHIENLKFTIVKSPRIKGSSYLPTPSWINAKKAVINIKNDDNKCFIWSILAALHPASSNVSWLPNYSRYINELNLTNLQFPMDIKQIPKFEELNNISINVFIADQSSRGELFIPIYISKFQLPIEIDLLLLQNENYNISNGVITKDGHYVLIKNFGKLVGISVNKAM